jgi:hypothetical protein
MVKRSLLGGIALVLATSMLAAPASARNLYFDMWCQEQGYEKTRCDERRPEDVALFEEYWRAVEKYEERYVVERQDYKNFKERLNTLDETADPGFKPYDNDRSPRPN